ncbi:Uncharacterised protein g4704 [Pycnogonum litorale]
MKIIIGLIALNLFVCTLIQCYPSRNFQNLQIKRGFSDRQMSTARSFGKRQQQRRSNILPESSKGVRVEWLAEHLEEDPRLAQKIISSFLDLDGDDIITPDEVYSVVG